MVAMAIMAHGVKLLLGFKEFKVFEEVQCMAICSLRVGALELRD